jgi:hypothetical protein
LYVCSENEVQGNFKKRELTFFTSLEILFGIVPSHFVFKMFFFGLPYLATYIFSYFSTNEPELGAGIDPGVA